MSRVDTAQQLRGLFKAAEIRLDGGALDIRITDWKDPKTNPQLAKIHGMIRDFAISQDDDPRRMKVRLKFALGFTEYMPTLKGEMEIPKSFGKAKIGEVSDMIDRLQAMAIENGIELREEL